MMKTAILVAFVVCCAVVAAYGQFTTLDIGLAGTGVVPSCSNSLDFTDACNSQYIAVIF